MRQSARRVLAAALAVTALGCGAAACTPTSPPPTGTSSPTTSAPPEPEVARLRLPDEPTTVLDATSDVAASRALFVDAPVVVLAPSDDVEAQVAAASAAVAVGGPLLLVPPDGPATAADATDAPATDAPDATTTPGPSATSSPAEDPPWLAEVHRLHPTAVLVVTGADGRLVDLRVPQVPTVTVAPADGLVGLAGLSGPPTAVDAADAVTAVAGLDRDHPTLLGPASPEPTGDGTTATGAADATATRGTSTSAAPSGTAPAGSPVASDAATTGPVPSPQANGGLPDTRPAPAPGDGVLLTDGDPGTLAAVATARAAGLPAVVVPGGDPRATAATVTAVAHVTDQETHLLAVGPAFAAFGGPAEVDWRVRAAATGVQLPGGGQLVFAHRRLVALYGSPGVPGLGVLGEQDLPATITRAKDLASTYQALTDDTVEPSLEIIATVASRGAGDDGNYSDERAAADLLPWVEAAEKEGLFVILDLQPGRTDFLTQAKQYETLLAHPNVGLALDPEWRLKPDQVHLRQIGSVDIAEVNQVVTWLADLTRREHLPQKVLVLHQFSLSMIRDRGALDTSRAELQIVLHVDGQGSQPAKAGTWKALQRDAPAGVLWGWKNFIDEDHPVLTPEQTYQVKPPPVLVTYQ